MRRVHVVVSGNVQGVGYRYTARLQADRLGVTGWIRNRRDGTVEAEVEGSLAAVDDMLAWMAEGPPGSTVSDARVTDVTVAQTAGSDATGRRTTTFDVLDTV